jgi:hypothetical protein
VIPTEVHSVLAVVLWAVKLLQRALHRGDGAVRRPMLVAEMLVLGHPSLRRKSCTEAADLTAKRRRIFWCLYKPLQFTTAHSLAGPCLYFLKYTRESKERALDKPLTSFKSLRRGRTLLTRRLVVVGVDIPVAVRLRACRDTR